MNAFIAKTEDKEEVVKEYIPLVKYIASRVIIGKTKYVEFEDLVGYGMVGLMDAINKFDATKGMKFSTYASIRIKGAIIDEIRKNSPISKGAMNKLNRYNEAIEKLQKELFREPTLEEISREMGIPIENISEIENYINYISTVSLEDMIFSKEDDIPLMGIVEDKKSPCPEEVVEEKELLEILAKAIDDLNEKDRTVLSLYYYEGFTLKQIGKVLSVSESRVCQLHSRAIVHLRKIIEKMKYYN
ncbi:FliA/WhiG family RNA polymerase sigma factor [Hathewaya limosa]|uniref:RNA polymerase sigma factor for flagellar operon FliA n=1 Tax=Hathewaya limosa TaxID=1536 RepID=A0ABU0JT72_HATLI|nr:FliA/WhiG family RNA polymerase sigma factor [Hathewaya limosa]MDQ0479274.1 RNA polymerase sigma factor for flagellar operon FliA [Hathewaya limosa]